MKKLSKLFGLVIVSAVIIIATCTTGFAATVGQVLSAAEDSTWKRIEDDDKHINYEKTNLEYYISGLYSGKNVHYNWGAATGNIKFGFKGTKIRLILSNSDISTFGHHTVTIDGKTENLYVLGKDGKQIFAYEKTGLSDGIHNVTITLDNRLAFGLDAVDIDSNGYLVDFNDSFVSPNLSATVVNSKIELSWTETASSVNYIVKRSEIKGGPYTTIATDVTGTSYTDTDINNGTTYYYIVTMIANGRESGNSNEASATSESSQNPPTTETKLKVVLEVSEALRLSVDDDLNVNSQMAWESSDKTVATINEKGIVMALAPGNTIITVKSVDGTYTDYINVLVVENADDYRLAIDLRVGETARLTADDFKNTASITWAPMDSSIANVTSKGKVTALSKGLVLISAKDADGNIIGRVYVRVRE